MNFELLVATNNDHKLKEMRQILSPFHITVYGMKDLNIKIPDVEENGKSYYENALIKANALKEGGLKYCKNIITSEILANE